MTATAGLALDMVAGDLVAIEGPTGSGKSSLLLALTGRMALDQGAVQVLGFNLSADHAKVRGVSSVARLGETVEDESRLRVAALVGDLSA